MATASISLVNACAGGDHLILRLTQGAQTFDFNYTVDELRDAFTADEIRETVKTLTRFHCRGMTKLQARTELTPPGISVVTA